ncbi:uncharacterized protein Dana_GF19973 [Drosophila ananassae]|uniref:TGF-beta propeptide domain-containing protein n=1 Tax=Drosophila ananassae TaxID=7217 RepID=B3MY46_DROAN|nr:uncharacterized protein Dana_GF19973 [Drosophila ananassae]
MSARKYSSWEKHRHEEQYLKYIAKLKFIPEEIKPKSIEEKLFEPNIARISLSPRPISNTLRIKDVKNWLFLATIILFVSAQFVYGQEDAESYKKFFNSSGRPEYNIFSSNFNANALPDPDRIDVNSNLNKIEVNEASLKRYSSFNSSKIDIFSNAQTVSMNRNILLNFDNMLQRQLREKARLDSLESIKMHILMRLNLKQLPNITKPIPVPQNIIDNFYKDYNVSSQNVISNHAFRNIKRNVSQLRGANIEDFKDNESTQMQGDSSNTVNEFPNIYKRESNEKNIKRKIPTNIKTDDYESVLSQISSIYIFPEQIHHHTRSNLKTEMLRFKIANDYSELSYATLHLYVRGWDWIYVQQPELIEEIKNQQNNEVIVSIHRAARRATNFTHKVKMFEFRQSIPLGQGEWANIDVKPLFGDDLSNKTQEIQISALKSWMKSLIVTTDTASQNPLYSKAMTDATKVFIAKELSLSPPRGRFRKYNTMYLFANENFLPRIGTEEINFPYTKKFCNPSISG